jgi:hypothetical protein
MIIKLVGAATENVEAAGRSLAALTTSWGYQTQPAPTGQPTTSPDTKVIDPVAVASLIVSIPSAILAIADITDRVHKRRRADQLIKHAQQLKEQQTAALLVRADHSIDLATLSPDQLLDLIADDTGTE